MQTIAAELKRFQQQKKFLVSKFELHTLGDYCFSIAPRDHRATIPEGLSYLATIMGLSHGNEVAGAAVINDLLDLLIDGQVNLPGPIVFSLNNPEAALAEQRFVDEDLNRCFGATENPDERQDSVERRLIKPVEEALRQSAMHLDLHQTQLPLPLGSSFWPALDDAKIVSAICDIDPYAVVVKTPPISPERSRFGMSSDNFMHRQGKLGLTVELGSRGFDPYQISRGVHLAISFLNFAGQGQKTNREFHGKIYETLSVIPQMPGSELRSDLVSFLRLKKGEVFGQNADGSPLISPRDCRILFPKIRGKVAFSAMDPLCYLII